MEAKNILEELEFVYEEKMDSYSNMKDNDEIHDLLNDRNTAFQTLCDQDTWIFSDGSYITRLVDDYFIGDDIIDFEIIHDEQISATRIKKEFMNEREKGIFELRKKAKRKAFSHVRLEESLAQELREFLPVYSRKVKFRVTISGFVEKAVREALEREKLDIKNTLLEK